MEQTEKTILKTSLITVGIMLALFIVFIAVMSVFFPKQMYNFSSKYGFEKLAFTYAESQYKKSKDINDLHTLIYSAYEINNNGAIIKYSEKLFSSADYEDFIVYINDFNLKSVSIEQAQIVLSNENNYLKNKYVQALCNKGKFDEAVDFAISELDKESDWALPERTTWMLGTLLSYQSNQDVPNYDFLQTLNTATSTYIQQTQIYIDELILQYNNLKNDITIIDNGQYEKNVLAYDLNQYLSHIIFLENKVTLPLHNFEYYKEIRQNL